MRNEKVADALFPRIRRDLLAHFLLHPERSWFLSDLARHLGVGPSSLQRELASLTEAGILIRRVEGKNVYFQADPDSPVAPELRGLMLKTVGLVDAIRDALKPLREEIDLAFVFGSMATGKDLASSDVDLLIVGSVKPSELTPRLRKLSDRLGRVVSPKVFPLAELQRRAGEHFLRAVIDSPKLFVIGSRHELEEALGGESSRKARDERRRDRRAP